MGFAIRAQRNASISAPPVAPTPALMFGIPFVLSLGIPPDLGIYGVAVGAAGAWLDEELDRVEVGRNLLFIQFLSTFRRGQCRIGSQVDGDFL